MAEETTVVKPSEVVTVVPVVSTIISDVPEAEQPEPEPEAKAKAKVEMEMATTNETTVTTVDESNNTVSPTNTTVDEKADEKTLITQEKETTVVKSGEGDNEKKALAELKVLIQNALNNHEFSTVATAPPPQTEAPKEEEEVKVETKVEEVVVDTVVVPTEGQDDSKVEEVEAPKEEVDPPQEEVVKKVNIDEDGTRTVEAIEETVVSVVSSTASSQQQTPQQTPVASAAAVDVSSPPAAEQEEKTPETKETPLPEEVSLWGVPLMKDERTDTILWKFLLARDFRVKDAFAMIKNTIKWRKEFGIDELVEQDLGFDDLEKAAFMYGVSKEGNPVCYNVYGAFQDKELYQKAFSDEEKREKFLKWRVQLLERSVRKLDFYPGGISTMVQVNDLKNSPGPGKWELRQATKHALHLLQDNYPEFVAKQVFINVPWWYMALNKMISPFLTHRTKSKFVVAGPSKSAETLFNYVAPEQVPVQYGGLSRKGEFETKDGVTQIIVKPASKETVEFAVTEACHLTWEVRVLGWEVNYGAEFVPNAKESYTVIIQKIRKVGAAEETIISNSFKTSEPGKVVLTIDNTSSKKKRLLYRLKSNPSTP